MFPVMFYSCVERWESGNCMLQECLGFVLDVTRVDRWGKCQLFSIDSCLNLFRRKCGKTWQIHFSSKLNTFKAQDKVNDDFHANRNFKTGRLLSVRFTFQKDGSQ